MILLNTIYCVSSIRCIVAFNLCQIELEGLCHWRESHCYNYDPTTLMNTGPQLVGRNRVALRRMMSADICATQCMPNFRRAQHPGGVESVPIGIITLHTAQCCAIAPYLFYVDLYQLIHSIATTRMNTDSQQCMRHEPHWDLSPVAGLPPGSPLPRSRNASHRMIIPTGVAIIVRR